MTDDIVRGSLDIEPLVVQARAWETHAAAALSRIGVKADWACLDLACGPVGILPLLAGMIGPSGRIVGVERDPYMVGAAREIVRSAGREDVELVEADAASSGLPGASFDLVHGRFLLGHVADPSAMLTEMLRLTKPGGTVLVQEPDHSSWNFYPSIEAWPRLLSLGEQAFARAGVEINIGRRCYQLLRDAGLEDVTIAASVLALQDGHPYMSMGLKAAEVMGPLMVKAGLTTDHELSALTRALEEHIARPDTWAVTFTTVQVWGRRR